MFVKTPKSNFVIKVNLWQSTDISWIFLAGNVPLIATTKIEDWTTWWFIPRIVSGLVHPSYNWTLPPPIPFITTKWDEPPSTHEPSKIGVPSRSFPDFDGHPGVAIGADPRAGFQLAMGVPKNSWMVYIMENPHRKWMIFLGGRKAPVMVVQRSEIKWWQWCPTRP